MKLDDVYARGRVSCRYVQNSNLNLVNQCQKKKKKDSKYVPCMYRKLQNTISNHFPCPKKSENPRSVQWCVQNRKESMQQPPKKLLMVHKDYQHHHHPALLDQKTPLHQQSTH
jgi:hypothetical protein